MIGVCVQLLLTTPILAVNHVFYSRGILAVARTGAATMDTLVALGTGAVVLLYLGLNVVYLYAVPIGEIGSGAQSEIAMVAAETLLGPVASRLLGALDAHASGTLKIDEDKSISLGIGLRGSFSAVEDASGAKKEALPDAGSREA